MVQPLFLLLSILFNKSTIIDLVFDSSALTVFYRNIRRCVNATGRLSNNGNTSPPLHNRTNPTGVLSSSSRPSQPSPNLVHHRGAYYTILRPSSRRTDVGILF